MATEIKKFLDQGGVSTLWSKVAEKIAAEEARAKAAEEAAAAAAKKAQDDVDALEGYVGTFTASEGVDTVVKYIDAKTANIASDETVSALADRVTQAENDIDAIEADYLKKADKDGLQEQITANANAITLLTNGASAEEVDGVNDLINYVKEHGTEVTGMKANIAANAKAIADQATADAAAYETKTDAAAKLTEAKDYTDAAKDALFGTEDDTKLDNTIMGLKAYADSIYETTGSIFDLNGTQVMGPAGTLVEALNNTARYIDTNIGDLSKLSDVLSNQSVVDALNILMELANGLQTGVEDAEKNAKAYADSLAGNYDAAGAADTAEQNAKDYADSLATNYDAAGSADTAEQNAKDYADGLYNAIQALTTEDIEAAIAQATV